MPVEPIGRILLRSAGLAERDLDDALARREPGGERIGETLCRLGLVRPGQVSAALAEQWGLPFLDHIPPHRLDEDLVIGLRFEFLRQRLLLPLTDGDGGVEIVMADPLDVEAFDNVAAVLGRPCARAVAPAAVIEEALTRRHYQQGESAASRLEDLDEDETLAQSAGGAAEDLMDVANRPPIVRLINTMFFQALRARASDIHVEPYEQKLSVRFRIDGVLHERFTPPKQFAAALVSRLKIMADMNIAERRLPQDGRSRVRFGDQEIDIRVSTIPTACGERVVLRLLDKSSERFGLSELGFEPRSQARFERLVRRPHGIFLLTGPTGSGKTTTLYAALSTLNTEERNILTVEDPVEYQIPGVGQMQVQPKIGLNFANSLRHILRQDPDVIMVGEIRDLETAEIAIQAALTGHLVFSTLHTNDSGSAFTRLLDMGIEPYLASSSVIGVMAQRLVRVICEECRTAAEPDESARLLFGPEADRYADRLRRGAGCEACFETGYRGRSGIFELLPVDDEVRELVMTRANAAAVKQAAVDKGMSTLRDDGVRNILAGVTTVDEVLRATQEDVEVVEG